MKILYNLTLQNEAQEDEEEDVVGIISNQC